MAPLGNRLSVSILVNFDGTLTKYLVHVLFLDFGELFLINWEVLISEGSIDDATYLILKHKILDHARPLREKVRQRCCLKTVKRVLNTSQVIFRGIWLQYLS